jgi:outer membrane protein
MPNKLTSTLLVVNFIGVLALLFLHFYDREKVVFIDSAKVINGYQGMIEARAAYQNKVTAWKANIDTLAQELQQDITKYQQENSKMTAREKELSKQLIQTKQQQLADYQKAINERAGAEDAEATRKVISEINSFIKTYGEQENYTIVFAATEYGNIAYAKDYLDITDNVIEGLNKKYATR